MSPTSSTSASCASRTRPPAPPPQSPSRSSAPGTIAGLRERAAELQGRLGHADALVETLRDQLSIKDRQLAKQGDQITQLIARLGMIGGAA
ncbi:hypothetical protein EKO23_04775 [Nocardioides guangzhouensis]|uniref:Uncharacterized protein n=1 Tax=Nocardioides guangzhouensis TaxID=2497878 RepID=A0A4Q4ZJN5_9ACTN|nr:hypothetical protein [Nocardioides guangzhouensis]RYP87711.1 hypothetical protein EKO23_04775 [Nocardioides guangzhouensis]